MDKFLTGIPKSAAFINDIVVAGKTKEEHLELLRSVFSRLKNANVRAKLSKCYFLKSEVIYLGHCIDCHGIHPTEDYLDAIEKCPHLQTKRSYGHFWEH